MCLDAPFLPIGAREQQRSARQCFANAPRGGVLAGDQALHRTSECIELETKRGDPATIDAIGQVGGVDSCVTSKCLCDELLDRVVTFDVPVRIMAKVLGDGEKGCVLP